MNILEQIHEQFINNMILVGEEVWVAADDGLSVWDAKSGKFVLFASKRPKFQWKCLVETSTAIWAGTSSGAIVLFDIKVCIVICSLFSFSKKIFTSYS